MTTGTVERTLTTSPEAERAYIAMAKLKMLEQSLREFRGMRFTKTNERPEANIGNKTKALEALEQLAQGVIKIGTKVKNIRLVDSDHDIDCKIDGFGAMSLKSEFVKKV